jgi:glycosyltransferase involved in cell wall biosynthesis
MTVPFVTIIVPAYHDWNRLKVCVDALAKQTYPQDRYEVIIVNNDPLDTCPLDSFPSNCKVINENTPGSYAARNAGLAIAVGEIYGFTDSDCIPDPGWIENAVSFLQKNPEIHRVGGKVKLFFRTDKLTPAEVYEMFFAFPQESYVNKRGMAVTANMFAFKSVFDSIGPFRDDLFSGGDYEWAQRAQKNGIRIGYDENVLVLHPARCDMKQIIRKTRRVAGGRHILKKQGLLWSYGNFSISIIPPIKSIFSVLKFKASFSQKITAIGIRYFLRVIRGVELVRVYHSGKAKN